MKAVQDELGLGLRLELARNLIQRGPKRDRRHVIERPDGVGSLAQHEDHGKKKGDDEDEEDRQPGVDGRELARRKEEPESGKRAQVKGQGEERLRDPLASLERSHQRQGPLPRKEEGRAETKRERDGIHESPEGARRKDPERVKKPLETCKTGAISTGDVGLLGREDERHEEQKEGRHLERG